MDIYFSYIFHEFKSFPWFRDCTFKDFSGQKGKVNE